MSDSAVVIILSFLMFIGSMAAGLVPLAVTLSESSLQLVSTFGAGLLVGAALAVIIPEGVNMLYTEKLEELKATLSPAGATEHDHAHESSNLHVVIGASLVLGFVFMMLVDQISSGRREADNSSKKTFTATVGLVVHAAADGIALGAAVITSQKDIEVIVFLAIMLHKAPAAFGLVTFLMHEGILRNNIRKHLLVFSSAAPIAAIITFYGLSQENKATLSSLNGTGIAMLFSAGTFLYVATVHVLPEIAYGTSSHSNSLDTGRIEKSGFTRTELIFLVVGSVLPLVLSMSHSH